MGVETVQPVGLGIEIIQEYGCERPLCVVHAAGIIHGPANQAVVPVELYQRGDCFVVPVEKVAAQLRIIHVPLVVIVHGGHGVTVGQAEGHRVEKNRL